MNKLITSLCFICLFSFVQAQTVGTLLNTEDSFDGYTLFNGGPGLSSGPGVVNQGVYLVNNCGELINSWISENGVGLASKLMHDGSIVRGIQYGPNNMISNGGKGGGVEILGWDGSTKWVFDYNSNNVHMQHHDIMPMPNGNIMILAWELRSAQEAIDLGRQDGSSMVSERIIEVTPDYTDGTSGTIVWQWEAFDHSVQNVDPALGNFGDLLANNSKFNINKGSSGDWLHFNAIDYIEEFDQLVISSRFWDEVFVIDHSTTTAEAATSGGGNYGQGGDILYRWGSPVNYNGNGTPTLADNHGVRYSPTSYTNGGTFSVFNNGGGSNSESTIVSWTPPMNADGSYNKEADGSYGPASPDREYTTPNASTGSNCQGMPNGNLLYCVNSGGNLGEFDLDGNLVWQYKLPLDANGAVTQGSNPGTSSFNAERYHSSYPGLADKDLTPGDPIELNPIIGNCTLYPDVVAIDPPAAAYTTVIDEDMVTFTDSSTGDSITEWLWEFGDGNSSYEQNPVYTYTASGTYNVCLTVTNAGGSNTNCQDVTITLSSINEFVDLGFNLYPNPVEDMLFINGTSQEYRIELLDVSGQIIFEQQNQEIIDFSDINPGIYFINIITERGVQAERIIVR